MDQDSPLGCISLTRHAQLVRAITKVIIEVTLALTVLLNIGICICEWSLSFSAHDDPS